MKLNFYKHPNGEWQCTDYDTFDMTEDSAPINRVVGLGVDKEDAAEDWFKQFSELEAQHFIRRLRREFDRQPK